MRKILFIIFCAVSMAAYSQKCYVKNVYEDKVISKTQHLTFKGISFGLSKNAFKKSLKQKGYVFTDERNDYIHEEFKKNNKGIPCTYYTVTYSEDYHGVKGIDAYCKFYNKQKAAAYFNSILSSFNKTYLRKNVEKRLSSRGSINLTTTYIYDIFSNDNKFHVGNIEIQLENNPDINEYHITLRYHDIANNFKQGEYVVKIYDLCDYVYPQCKAGYFYEYPYYKEVVLRPINSTNYIHFDESADNEMVKFLNSSNYTQDEKKYIIQKAIMFTKPLQQFNPAYVYDTFGFYTAELEYKRAKEEYLKAHNNNSSQMSAGEAMFCLWEGEARIAKYKADGSYQTRMRNFIRRWNAVAGSGGGSTNWDGLSDAQKAAIHEHDNAR